MKIIDLLNKIANGEEVPEIIVAGENGDKHYFDKELKEYINVRTKEKLFEDGYGKYLKYFINDEVEIIEEDKKIEKLESYISCGWNGTCKDYKREELFESLSKIGNKINEIIDEVNKLKDDRK